MLDTADRRAGSPGWRLIECRVSIIAGGDLRSWNGAIDEASGGQEG